MHPVNSPEVLISQAGDRFDENGNLTDAATEKIMRQALENLVEWARRLQAGATPGEETGQEAEQAGA